MVWFCLIGSALAEPIPRTSDFKHTVRFRTHPEHGVIVTVDGEAYPVSQNVTLDYSFGPNSKQALFYRLGYKPRTSILNATDVAAVNIQTRLYPPEGSDPIILEANNPYEAVQAWRQDHPFGALTVLALALTLPAAGYRLQQEWRRRKLFHQRFSSYEANVDRGDPLLLQTLEGYMLVQALGKGGMATVYKGVPAATLDETQAVAVKILSRELFADKEFYRRFRREVQAYQLLNHPNIVRVYSWREPDENSSDSPYIILELIQGRTLSQNIPATGLNWNQAAPLLEQIFSAVAYAHEQGVVHRDLKPDNIMVTSNLIKVMDFGLARNMDASQLTASGTVLGTPAYMAPEQLSRGSAESAVDQYALGVIAYRMLHGRLPHEADDLMQLFAKVLSGAPVPPRTYRPSLSPLLEQTLLKMLHLNPKDRFASVESAWRALRSSAKTGVR